MKFVLIGLLIFFIISLLFIATNKKRKFNVMKTIFSFLCALAFLLMAIYFKAYLMIIGTILFIVIGIICAKNIDDNL